MVLIIIMLKVLKFHQMIIYGNVLLKIFVEVIHEENEYILELIDFIYRYVKFL